VGGSGEDILLVLNRFGEGIDRSYIKKTDNFMFVGVCLSSMRRPIDED
jgi:hypothetical protein